jgi:predicted transcriptional regulator of viral defense system
MNWNLFLKEFAQRPLFHSSMLAIFPDPPAHKQVQLCRWTRAGKLSQLRRGWYLIEKPWRTREVPIAVMANSVVHPSYLSLDWALQYYEMIPEYVPNPTSVTTDRGVRFTAQNSLFIYYHIQPSFFKGYRQEKVNGHKINIACPEKALVDKIYLFLQRNRFSIEWLKELRLQNLDSLNLETLEYFSRETKRKKFREAIELTYQYIKSMRGEES